MWKGFAYSVDLTYWSYHAYSSYLEYSSYLSYFICCTYSAYYAYAITYSSSKIWFWKAPGQSAYADNECPDIVMLKPVQPQVPVQPEGCLHLIFTNAFVAWAEMLQPCLKHWIILIRVYPLDQLLCTANALEEALGKTIHIQHIL